MAFRRIARQTQARRDPLRTPSPDPSSRLRGTQNASEKPETVPRARMQGDPHSTYPACSKYMSETLGASAPAAESKVLRPKKPRQPREAIITKHTVVPPIFTHQPYRKWHWGQGFGY